MPQADTLNQTKAYTQSTRVLDAAALPSIASEAACSAVTLSLLSILALYLIKRAEWVDSGLLFLSWKAATAARI